MTFRNYLANYTTVLELWQRFTTDSATPTNLYARATELITELQKYPYLGGGAASTYRDSSIEGAEDPIEMLGKDGSPAYLKWELRLRWQEEIEVTFSE
jgi:hypothetical protein